MPNLFKAISSEIASNPAGSLFSMSFGLTEQTFGGAAKVQTAKFDADFQQGLAKGDNFFASSGDNGTFNNSKQKKDSGTYNFPTVGWPASSPYVTSVGGTHDPAYYASIAGGDTEAVWNESWGPIGTGGGVSAIYAKPSWQNAGPSGGRVVPDTSWNAAVNGGVDVWITSYPDYNCGNTTGCWTFYGGTSASSPQTAGLAALVNAARADAGKSPVGFVAPLLYGGIGANAADYKDIVPLHYGSAPKTFSGTDVGVAGTVQKSAGDLVDNQMWQVPVAGYPTTSGFDATTGWGTPQAPGWVAALTATP
jgi:subtilase family serine protease